MYIHVGVRGGLLTKGVVELAAAPRIGPKDASAPPKLMVEVLEVLEVLPPPLAVLMISGITSPNPHRNVMHTCGKCRRRTAIGGGSAGGGGGGGVGGRGEGGL